MNCAITPVLSASTIELTGRAWSEIPATGRYRFVMSKRSPAGVSNVAQMGEFAVSPDRSAETGYARMNFEPTAVYEAHLVIQWEGGELECEYTSAV